MRAGGVGRMKGKDCWGGTDRGSLERGFDNGAVTIGVMCSFPACLFIFWSALPFAFRKHWVRFYNQE